MMWHSARARRRDEALLVAFAERLCADSAAVEMRPEFRASLRATLVAEAPPATASAQKLAPTHRARPLRRRMAVVTGLVTATLGLAGMVTMSASALPGDALYPVKRTAERAEMAFHRATAERGAFHLELAGRRLDEATRLFNRGAAYTDLGVAALQEFDREAVEGSDALVKAYRADNSRASIATLNRFSAEAMRKLSAMQSSFTGPEVPELTRARERVTAIAAMTGQLCPDCAGGATAQTFSESPSEPEPTFSDDPPATDGVAGQADARVPARLLSAHSNNDDEGDDESDDSDESDSDRETTAGSSAPAIPPVPSLIPKAQNDEHGKRCASGNVVVDLIDCVDDLVDPASRGLGINLDDD